MLPYYVHRDVNALKPKIGRFCGPKTREILSIFTTIKDIQKTSFGLTVPFNCINYEYENTAISKLANATIKIEEKMTKFMLVS